MPRPRTNDPSNLPEAPRITKAPEREAEIVPEFKRRLGYIRSSFCIAQRALTNDHAEFSHSLARLRRRVRSAHRPNGQGDRIHPEIETVITHLARKLAEADGCEVAQRHANAAARIAVNQLKPTRGRPDDRVLGHHVRGLMAVIQETTGLPVIARRDRNSIYGLHFADGAGQLVPQLFQDIDPTITTTRLVNIVRKVRKEFAGRSFRFLDLFPFYVATLVDGEIRLRPGLRLERFEPNIPIYCP